MRERSGKYSCESANETLEWIKAIVDFIKPYESIISAHLVNFFNDRLWESVNEEWLHCLSHEPLHHLLLIPSGIVQNHWPASLKQFLITLSSLVFPREQVDLNEVLTGISFTSISSVLGQGMNMKKKHEVEVLSAVVSSVANSVRAQTVVDVGAGQGYLAQVLSFQYHHSVVAIDSSSHHGTVTKARAERIKKHYTAQMRKTDAGNRVLNMPRTITCNVLSVDTLKSLASMSLHENVRQPELSGDVADSRTSFILAGLHACGDLSVTMLKTFLECKEVKAVVSVGCCYNLLSEECFAIDSPHRCFPMSSGVKCLGISLGKKSRDLACQSAERWRSLDKDTGLQNFELHAFRAAFQMVLCKYYPEMAAATPSIGRQGKAFRRQHQTRILLSTHGESKPLIELQKISSMEEICLSVQPRESKSDENVVSELGGDALSCNETMGSKANAHADKNLLFEKFSQSGLSRLDLKPLEDVNLHETWKETEPFADLIGPFWSIRAAFGPLLETLLLLDRLLVLQEQGSSVETMMLPIFDPVISPRNVAIIAKRR
ncbi:S-adenosyl-L-methionine-dependent methyltransferases superfamily protein [Euphorbia peplus]|nr:S-adenosyl-L-methionine-dependent methyltransferases superfamily protein [Euphorbia peplus]